MSLAHLPTFYGATTKRKGKKKKKKRADARRERYSVKGTDTADTERYDTSSKGRCLAHRHQPGPPFLPPRPIDRSSGLARCLPGRHHIRTPPSTAPSSTHQPSGPLIGISTILPSLFVLSGAANQPTRRLVLFPWLWGERGETDWLWAWTGP